MKSSDAKESNGEVRVELKYCEHCGGLWVRESGAGTVYCENCQAKVADLPTPKKKPGRVILPQGPQTEVERYGVETDPGENDLEAAGGAA
jgi:ribosomal protein L37AE/L43A